MIVAFVVMAVVIDCSNNFQLLLTAKTSKLSVSVLANCVTASNYQEWKGKRAMEKRTT